LAAEVKEKAPSWVLGACTQREAVGGDSPPGMLSVDPRLAVSEKDVQYYLLDYWRGAGPWRCAALGPKDKGPELGNSGPALRGQAVGGDSPPGMLSVEFILAI
jgi:hypothetical protein